MSRIKFRLALVLATLMLGSGLNAALGQSTLYVDASWTEGSCGGHTWGVDAFNSINGAAAKADVSGGVVTIQVAAGTYGEEVNLKKDNLTFIEGDKTWYGRLKLVGENGANITKSFTFGNGPTINVADLTIEGFTFTGEANSIYIDNNGALGKNITIKNNNFNFQGAGIYVMSANLNGLTVTGNNFNSTSYNNATLGGNACQINNTIISNNTFANFFGLYGQVLEGGVTVSGNTFTASRQECIWMNKNNTKEGYTGKVTFSGNTIPSTIKYAIEFNSTYIGKDDIIIGEGNTYGGQAITGWANDTDKKFIVSSNADAGGGLFCDGKLYLGSNTAFTSLSGAIVAARDIQRSEKNSAVITIMDGTTVAGFDFNGDNTGITVVGQSKTGHTISGEFGSTGNDTKMKNTTFKNLNFVGGKITFSTNVSDYTGFTIEGCTMDGTGAGTNNPSAITVNRNDTVCADGLTIKDNVIKNYYPEGSATGILVGNSTTLAHNVAVTGNTISNVGFNAVQLLGIDGLTLTGNTASGCLSWAMFNLSETTNVTFDNNTATLQATSKYTKYTSQALIGNANGYITLGSGNKVTTVSSSILTDPCVIVLNDMKNLGDPYYNDQVIFVTDATQFEGGKIVGGQVMASAANINSLVANSYKIGFLESVTYSGLVYYTDVANKTVSLAYGKVGGILDPATITVPSGFTFSLGEGVTFTPGSKIYIPFVTGSAEFNAWVSANIAEDQKENVSVFGYACSIGETIYYSLAEAVNAVLDNQTIKLLSNLSESVGVTTKSNISFSIDMNGFNYANTSTFANNSTNIALLDSSTAQESRGKISVGTFTNSGILSIDMTGATEGSCTLIEASETASYGTGGTNWKFVEGKAYGYKLKVKGKNLMAISSVEVTITSSGYSTIFYDDNLEVPDGVLVYGYVFDSANGALAPKDVILPGSIIPENKGFVVKGTAGTTYKFGVTSNEAGVYQSDLTGYLTSTNTDDAGKIGGKEVYVLWSKTNGKTTFYKYKGEIPANKAVYLKTAE